MLCLLGGREIISIRTWLILNSSLTMAWQVGIFTFVDLASKAGFGLYFLLNYGISRYRYACSLILTTDGFTRCLLCFSMRI